MKKLGLIIICICLLFTACSNDNETEISDGLVNQEDSKEFEQQLEEAKETVNDKIDDKYLKTAGIGKCIAFNESNNIMIINFEGSPCTSYSIKSSMKPDFVERILFTRRMNDNNYFANILFSPKATRVLEVIGEIGCNELSEYIIRVNNINDGSVENTDLLKKIKTLPDSINWIDEDNIVYSDRDGDLIKMNMTDGSKDLIHADSVFKTDVSMVDNKFIYIKKAQKYVEWYKENKESDSSFIDSIMSNGDCLAFTGKENQVDSIAGKINDMTIKSYKISTDNNRIALYYESEDDKAGLYIVDIEGTLFSKDIEGDKLVSISDKKVGCYNWSHDSTTLYYTLNSDEVCLKSVSCDGEHKKSILENKKILDIIADTTGIYVAAIEEGTNKVLLVKTSH